jgi:MFS family permease
MGLGWWFFWLCMSRVANALIFSAYAGVMSLCAVAWHLSSAEAGAVQSAWHVGYLVSLVSVGILADRIGAKAIYLRTGVAAGLSAVAFAWFANGFVSAVALYGLAGLFAGGSYTPGLKVVFEQVPERQRGLAMGLFLAAASIGYGLALFVGSALAPAGHWRAALEFSAVASCVGALLGYVALWKVPNVRHESSAGTGKAGGWSSLFRNKAAVACTLAYTCHCWELFGMWAWLPTFLSTASSPLHGSGIVAKGLLIAASAQLISSVGNVLGGGLSDRLGRSRVMMLMTCVSISCSFTIGWLTAAPLWLTAAVAIAYNFFAISDSSVYSIGLAEVVAPAMIGTAYSLRSVLGFGVGAVSPWLFGAILDASRAGPLRDSAWILAWSSLGVGALVGPFMIAWFAREQRRVAGTLTS